MITIGPKAWELVEKGWCQINMAQNEKGRVVYFDSDDASKYCILGTLCKAYPYREDLNLALDKVNKKLGINSAVNSVSEWNDKPERTQSEVVELLKSLDL